MNDAANLLQAHCKNLKCVGPSSCSPDFVFPVFNEPEFDSGPAGEAHEREFGLNWGERQGAGAGVYLCGGGGR